jgi:hypothetical protein
MAREYEKLVAQGVLSIIEHGCLDLVLLAEAGEAGFNVATYANDVEVGADRILDGSFS